MKNLFEDDIWSVKYELTENYNLKNVPTSLWIVPRGLVYTFVDCPFNIVL